MLGPSETVGRHAHLFELISSRWRVYQKAGPTRRQTVEIPIESGAMSRQPVSNVESVPTISVGLAELMQKQLLAEFAPAAVLINHKFEVLCFQGPTVNYLEFPSGEPTRDLLALARQGLRTRLRAMVTQAIQTGEPVTDAAPRVKRDGRYFSCQVTVKPLMSRKSTATCCW